MDLDFFSRCCTACLARDVDTKDALPSPSGGTYGSKVPPENNSTKQLMKTELI